MNELTYDDKGTFIVSTIAGSSYLVDTIRQILFYGEGELDNTGHGGKSHQSVLASIVECKVGHPAFLLLLNVDGVPDDMLVGRTTTEVVSIHKI